jgi:hypothetical protein
VGFASGTQNKAEKNAMGLLRRPCIFTREDFLERAEEMRTLADQMSTPDAKQKIIGLAESYQNLAKHAPKKAYSMAQVKLSQA